MKKSLYAVIGILVALLIAHIVTLRKVRAEKERLEANQTALLSQVEYWTTKSGKSAADVRKLTLTVDELKQSNAALKKTADDLGIKLKRVQSASTTGVKTEVKFITQVRDSIVYRDSIIVQNISILEVYLDTSCYSSIVLLVIELFHKVLEPEECIFLGIENSIIEVSLIFCLIKFFLCSLLLTAEVISISAVRQWITIRCSICILSILNSIDVFIKELFCVFSRR